MIFLGYVMSLLYGGAVLLFGFVLYRNKVPLRITRKFVHVLIGFEWLILRLCFGSTIHLLVVCLAFTALLTVTYFGKRLPMIASDSDNAPGTVYYGIAMSILALFAWLVPQAMLPFGIGVFATSFGDGFAGLIGSSVRKYNPNVLFGKTLFGFLANFLITAVCTGVISVIASAPLGIWHWLAIGLFSACIELVTPFGFDNLTVSLGSAGLSYALMFLPATDSVLLSILATPILLIFVIRKKSLTKDGIICAFLAEAVISVAYGNSGFLVLLLFFMGGSAADKVKKSEKQRRGIPLTEEKNGRTSAQVLCNAGFGMLSATLYCFFPSKVFLIGYLSSMCEALSDTVSSGVGFLAEKTYDIFHLKTCQRGVSGGMSLIGTVAGLTGSAVLALICKFLFALSYVDVLLIAGIGFAGNIFDSFAGVFFQAKYRCSVCAKVADSAVHCNESANMISGCRFITNNAVNALGTSFSGAAGMLLYWLSCAA